MGQDAHSILEESDGALGGHEQELLHLLEQRRLMSPRDRILQILPDWLRPQILDDLSAPSDED
jgi:hypothetical protein